MISASIKDIRPEEIQKIAILRANALGDFIVTLPAISALKKYFFNAEITLLGREWHKVYCEECENGKKRTDVDNVIVVPIMEGIREEKGRLPNQEDIDRFFEEATKKKFDIGINFQGKGIAAIPFFKKIKPEHIVSLTANADKESNFSSPFYYYQNEVLRYLDIISLLGVNAISYVPSIRILEKDKQEARAFLKEHVNGKYIAIHPCGSDKRRMWSKDKFAQLATALSKQGHIVVFTGSNDERNYIDSLISTNTSCINAAGKLSLGGLGALYNQSELVISVDTGPLHLAIASGAKTIGLYWAPNVINWAPLSRVKHRPVVNWEMKCPQCGIIPNDPYPYLPISPSCNHDVSFIEPITVDQILAEVEMLLT